MRVDRETNERQNSNCFRSALLLEERGTRTLIKNSAYRSGESHAQIMLKHLRESRKKKVKEKEREKRKIKFPLNRPRHFESPSCAQFCNNTVENTCDEQVRSSKGEKAAISSGTCKIEAIQKPRETHAATAGDQVPAVRRGGSLWRPWRPIGRRCPTARTCPWIGRIGAARAPTSGETACAPTQGGSWLEARGSHSVNQSLSRPAARHEVGSVNVVQCAPSGKDNALFIHARPRARIYLPRAAKRLFLCYLCRSVGRRHPRGFVRAFIAPLSSTRSGRIHLRVDARYRYGRTCESERANAAVSRIVASCGTSRQDRVVLVVIIVVIVIVVVAIAVSIGPDVLAELRHRVLSLARGAE